MTAPEPRPTCFVCFKPRSTCVCASITTVDNRTGVFVLQHPRERAHPIGTARFVELGLRNSQVLVASTAARDLHMPVAMPPGTGLLFPRDDARDLEELSAAERPEHLVVLDGTWPQARSLYRRNPWLHALPHYRLSPDAPSRYRIRSEPSPDYVSTIESVLLALRILEPETQGLPGLLTAFDTMIDTQVRHTERAIAAGTGRREKRARKKRNFRGVPRWLGDEYERLVGVYAEALPRTDADRERRQLLQLTAVHLSTGERYERLVVPPSGVPTEDALAQLGLCQGDFAQAIAPSDLAADFAAFVGTRVCVAWNRTTPSLMHDATGISHRIRLLNHVVRGLTKRGLAPKLGAGASPSLDRIAELALQDVAPLAFRGRAAERLANLQAMAEWIRERARCG